MDASFVIALGVALIAAYLSRHTQEIVSLFFLVIALLSALISFVLAPRFIKILLLLAGFLWAQQLCRLNDCDKAV